MKNEFHTIYLHECTSCVSRKYPGAWNLTIIVASVFQLRATKIYVNARPTVIMETSGRRKSVVSPIALSRFGRITCSRRSESVVVGTASRAVRHVLCCCRCETVAWLFLLSLPWSCSINDHLCFVHGVPAIFGYDRRLRCFCMRVCVRIPETEVRPTGEKGTRAGVEVYEVYRSLSRVSWGFRVQFFASLFERTIFFSWKRLWWVMVVSLELWGGFRGTGVLQRINTRS